MLCNPVGYMGVTSRASRYWGEGVVPKHLLTRTDGRKGSWADLRLVGWGGGGEAEQDQAF